MGNQQGQAFEDLRNTISETTRIVRQRWRLALMGVSTVATIAFWYSQYLPREYSASTIFERSDDVVLQNLIRRNSPYGFEHLKTTMKLDMVGSRAMARAVVSLGLLPPETFTSAEALTNRERSALEGVLGRYKIRPTLNLMQSTPNLDTIKLTVLANDPVAARRFVVALRDNYIEAMRARIRHILTSTKEFFEAETSRLQDKVAVAEEQLRQDLGELPVGVDPTDPVAMAQRIEHLRTQYNEAFQYAAAIEAQIRAREDFMATPPAYVTEIDEAEPVTAQATPDVPVAIADGPLHPGLEATISRVREQLIEALTIRRMTREHPTVKTLEEQMESLQALRAQIASIESAAPVTPVVAPTTQPTAPKLSKMQQRWHAEKMRVEMELDALQRQYKLALESLDREEKRLAEIESFHKQWTGRQDQLAELRRVRNENERELGIWQRHLTDLERVMAAESDERGTQFTLIEEPKNVSRPTQPRVASVFTVCSGLGLAVAALLVALAELLDRSFRSAGQVSRVLGIPVLESVGVIATPREQRKALTRRLVWAPTLTVLLLMLATSATLAYASLTMPKWHEHAIHRVNSVMSAVGLPQEEPPVDEFLARSR